MIINKPRGTNDIFGKDMVDYNNLVDTLKLIAKFYNYQQIITPIFESKELFIRNIGETTDIVTKEFYDFKDKGDRDMVLRPEGTVAVIRSVVENKMLATNPLPLKLFYIGPMFRYERPQKGRNRQFYQFGIETIGVKTWYEQIEVILMGITILNSLKVNNYVLKVNYIGSFETRKKWMDDLNQYFEKYKDQLTDDSVNRINKNPLRILDDKVDSKKDFVINAPKIDKYLNEEEKKELAFIKETLDKLSIKYEFDTTMVRGLDYYFGLVFEFVSTSKELSGNTIIGGGKYTKLVRELNGPDTDCIGFALGMERLIEAINLENNNNELNTIDIYLASVGNTKLTTIVLTNLLRANGFSVENNYALEKLDKHFKNASKYNPKYILIFGDKEKENESIVVKNQIDKKEVTVKIDDLIDYLKNNK